MAAAAKHLQMSRLHRIRRAVAIPLVLLFSGALSAAPGAVSGVRDPTVTGPIGDAGIHGHALWDSWFDLGDVGYTEDEYFVSGIAEHATQPNMTAPYTTRIIVTRPRDATDSTVR